MRIFDKIKSEYLSHKNIAGLYAIIDADEEINFQCLEIENEKGKLSVKKRIQDLLLKNLSSSLSSNIPVFIGISGRGIIHKKIELKDGLRDEQIIQKVLPNATFDDFYLQKQTISEHEIYATLVRKEFVDLVIDKLVAENIQIIDISFGPFALNNITNILSEDVNEINASNFNVSITNTRISNIQQQENEEEKTIRVGDEELQSHEIIPFALAISYYVNASATDFEYPGVNHTKEELKYKKLTKFVGWTVMIFFFALLLVNYFLYENYNSKYNSLNKQYFQNEKLIQQLNELKAEYKEKEGFITQTGLLDPTRFSLFVDRIGMHVPSNITLTKIDVQPIIGRVKQLKEIEFIEDELVIEGYTLTSANVDQWLKVLKKEDWVNNIEILNITKAERSSQIEFSLRLEI